uniref:Uncharacterized protein n=1 Tax=Timema douglasi TaxID=61478 RepID=A0A7R8VD56_TIMDO|nr:unnamed protein product [Timema douglasi]
MNVELSDSERGFTSCIPNLKSTMGDDPTLERHFRGHRDTVTSLSFHPTTKQLVSSSNDNSIMVWNFRQSVRAFRFEAHKDHVLDVSFSPSGNLVASASRDRSVRLWVPTVQGDSAEFRAHSAAVRSVHFSPDGKELVTSSDDKSAKLWTVSHRKFVSTFSGHNHWVRCVRFSPEGRLIATCSDDKTVKLFDHKTAKCVHTFHELKGELWTFIVRLNLNWWAHGLRCQPCQAWFTTDQELSIRILARYAKGRGMRSFKILNSSFAGSPLHVEFHPTGTCIATGMTNNMIKVYDVRMLKLLQQYVCHEGPINKVAFHPCGNYLISASNDSSLKVMDLLEGRPIYTLEGHRGAITALTFTANGEYFASGGVDHQILVWKTNFDKEDLLKEFPRKAETKFGSLPNSDSPVVLNPDGASSASDSGSSDIQVLNGEFRGLQVNGGRNGHGPAAEENEHLTDDSEENQDSNIVSARNYFNCARVNVSGAQGDLQANPVQRSIDNLSTQVEALTKTVALMEQKISVLENKLKNVLTLKNL